MNRRIFLTALTAVAAAPACAILEVKDRAQLDKIDALQVREIALDTETEILDVTVFPALLFSQAQMREREMFNRHMREEVLPTVKRMIDGLKAGDCFVHTDAVEVKVVRLPAKREITERKTTS
jgi:hypothetical protein